MAAQGIIFDRCSKRGTILRPTTRSREIDEAKSLAGETIVVAVRKFKETVLIPRVWRPDGGASLETFFIGQCLIRFPNIYRRWRKESGFGGADALDDVAERRSRSPLDAALAGPHKNRTDDPESVVDLEPYIDLAEDPVTKAVLAYVADDYTYEEIAQLSDLSVAAVKSRLYRLRQAQLAHQQKGGNDAA